MNGTLNISFEEADTLNLTLEDGDTVTLSAPSIPDLELVGPTGTSEIAFTGISGPKGDRGEQGERGPAGIAGNIEGDLPDFTLIFDNKLI